MRYTQKEVKAKEFYYEQKHTKNAILQEAFFVCFKYFRDIILHKECCYKCKNCIEFGESCVNHCVCLNVVSL